MFKISARTVLELGSELISSDIIAFYELVKNAIDAGSKSGATIRFNIILRKNTFLSIREKLLNGDIEDFDKFKATICEQLDQSATPEAIENANSIIKQTLTENELINALQLVYDLNSIEVADEGSGMTSQELQENF